jgi:hypothetical protein
MIFFTIINILDNGNSSKEMALAKLNLWIRLF